MALIKCPECGRENVSDVAESCPNCGYGIKNHFEIIRLEEANRRAEEMRQAEIAQKEQERIATKDQRQKQAIKDIEEEMKSKGKTMLISLGVVILSSVLLVITWNDSSNDDGLFIIMCACVDIMSIIFLFSAISDHTKLEKDLSIAKRDVDLYEEAKIQRLKQSAAIIAQMAEKEKIKHPICPVCGSNNTERISTTNRVVSVATVGLASGKIGKQYKCKKCKHMW